MDYHHLSRGRQKRKMWPRILLAGFVALMSVAVFSVYEYKSHPDWVESVAAYREHIGSWVSERKQSMRHGIGKVRGDVDEQSHEVRPVDFEFYSTLQEMNSMQAEAHIEAQRKIAEKESAVSKKVAVKRAPVKLVATKDIENTSHRAKKQEYVNANNHAADLEKDLLAAIKQ